jgi:DNA modification methylase
MVISTDDFIKLLEKMSVDLRHQAIEGISTRKRQSEIARLQIELRRQFESLNEQGKRTDLYPDPTCTSGEVQVGRRRASATEKVAKLFREGGETVRRRIFVYESAITNPERYGRFCRQMDEEDNPTGAANALKAYRRLEKIREQPIFAATRKRVARLGDVWRLGRHRLACGDATIADDVALLLNGATPILMVTDPPYGVHYKPVWRVRIGNAAIGKMGIVANDDRVDWSAAWDHFRGDVAYVWFADLHAGITQAGLEKYGLSCRKLIAWVKPHPVISRGHYRSQKETCWYAVRQGRTANWQGRRSRSDVWEIDNREDDGHGHPTQKPIECMLWPIEDNSAEGDGVYDPFVGSGTTLIAAEKSGRSCYAMDIDPLYCSIAIERWQNFTGKSAVLENTGQPFDEIVRDRLGQSENPAVQESGNAA